jgi:hypothetical protein
MTRERYNAFIAWTRSPAAGMYGTEVEYFSAGEEVLIGAVVLDHTDEDYGYVSLGRDEKGRFRCIEMNSSMRRLPEAREALFKSLKKFVVTGQTTFPQGDVEGDPAGVDLFKPIVPEEKWHPSYKLMLQHDQWSPAVGVLQEMMRHFIDIDGNFVQQFQTTAFDSRLWELYLYAYMVEEALFIERPKPAPDFSVSRGAKKVFIEAVTVGPTDNRIATPEDAPQLRSMEEIRELLKTKIPIKFGSALYSKMKRKPEPYWALPEVSGHPLVFAIADFHEKQSMTWTFPGLLEYLYAVTHDFTFDSAGQLVISKLKLERHEYEAKSIPSGFFFQPDSDNVSAVLFTSSGTMSKFNRMGRLAGFGIENMKLVRKGVCHDHSPNAALPRAFTHEVEHGKCTETWAEGLSMFHNPNARHPVPEHLFPSIAHHHFIDGKIMSRVPDFHPYASFTWNVKFTDAKSENSKSRGQAPQ